MEEGVCATAQICCLALIRKPILVGFIGSGLVIARVVEIGEVGAVVA